MNKEQRKRTVKETSEDIQLMGTTCFVITKRADVGLLTVVRSVKMQIFTLFLHIIMQ